MPLRNLRQNSRRLLQGAHSLTWNPIRLGIRRRGSDYPEGGSGPEGDCPHRKRVCRLGVRPICCRDPPSDYESSGLGTKTFEIPDFMDPKTFRPMTEDEVLGPNADKAQTYKNPEFFAYHRFSYYELKDAAEKAKQMTKSD